MLADGERVEAFAAALAEAVSASTIVLDIGAGTGILSMLACRAGARHAYAVEAGPVALLAEELIAANGLSERVTVIRGLSTEIRLPERADVLVSETLWNFGVGEGLLGWVADARERLLAPGATVIPRRVRMMVAPVEAERVRRRLEAPDLGRHRIDVSRLGDYLAEQPQTEALAAEQLLGEPSSLAETDLQHSDGAVELEGEAVLEVRRAGRLDGVGGWFEASLTDRVGLSNPPGLSESSWSNTVFPLAEPVAVQPGDTVRARIQSASNGAVFRWRLEVTRNGAELASEDRASAFGFPADRELLARAGSAAPRRGQRAECLAAAIELLDGSRPAAEASALLVERYPESVPTRAVADALIQEALARG